MFALVGKIVVAKVATKAVTGIAEGYLAARSPEGYAAGVNVVDKALDLAKAQVKGHAKDVQATVDRVKRNAAAAKDARDIINNLVDLQKAAAAKSAKTERPWDFYNVTEDKK